MINWFLNRYSSRLANVRRVYSTYYESLRMLVRFYVLYVHFKTSVIMETRWPSVAVKSNQAATVRSTIKLLGKHLRVMKVIRAR